MRRHAGDHELMATAGYIYLDIDDEITSAAARIRAAEHVRVALVLPAGSRLATSRINFRLLAREAQGRSRQLLIVAPEAATRSLAASAGLAVYASVRDLEADLEPSDGAEGPAAVGAAVAGAAGVDAAGGDAEPGLDGDDDLAGLTRSATVVPPPDAERRASTNGVDRPRREPSRTMAHPIAAGPVADAHPDTGVGRTGAGRTGVARTGAARTGADRSTAPSLPVARPTRGARRAGLAVALAGVLLFVLVGGVLGYLFLPAATIVVAPRVEPVGPMTLTVTADPQATAPNAEAGVVPATVATIPLEVTDEFPATGKKITETRAAGTVTFTNKNNADSVTIDAGTQVSTRSGVTFATTGRVVVPKAETNGVIITPGTADIGVRAVDKGTEGNVSAGAITKVSSSIQAALVNSEDPVNNAAPTSGGTHKETTIVAQKDIDKATTALTKQLSTELNRILANPGGVLPEMTIFPGTKSLSAPAPTVNPSTLVDRAVEQFSFGLAAVGSVTAVDEAAVRQLAETRLRGTIGQDRDIVRDSVQLTVDRGTVQGTTIAFTVHASAQQVRRIDAKQLYGLVKGKRVDDARAILGDYGEVTIDTWPGYVATIPTYDFRVQVSVKATAEVEGASPAPADESPVDLPSPTSGDGDGGSTEPSTTASP